MAAQGNEDIVVVDGTLGKLSDAVVPLLDRAFLFGDAVYEVLRTYDGKPKLIAKHLARLQSSCERIGIPLKVAASAIERDIHTALSQTSWPDSYIRLIVTRGSGALDLVPKTELTPRTVVIVKPLASMAPSIPSDGVRLITIRGQTSLRDMAGKGAKACNYLPSIMATSEAYRHNANEAIFLGHHGEVLEGATSNVFVIRGGELLTPPVSLGILGGITRSLVLELAPAVGLSAREALLFANDLYAADEVFITSSVRTIRPVRSVDGQPIGGGASPSAAERLRHAFDARLLSL